MGERSARERDAANDLPGLERPHLGDDAALAQVGHGMAPLGYDTRDRRTADEAGERFFTDFDMEILQSVKAASRRSTEAPPRPSGRRGRISERPQRPELTTLPLRSRLNASPFWIMLLLSLASLEHSVISMGAHRLIEV